MTNGANSPAPPCSTNSCGRSELKPAIPSFRLVYFDPKDKTYKTLITEPIPLQMKPAIAPKADAARAARKPSPSRSNA